VKTFRRIEDVVLWCERYRSAGLSVGFVPTMGALHEGHFTLLRHAVGECDRVVVSIFVNPTQFGPGEDLDKYPRRQEDDLEGCRSLGVDIVFLGDATDMYREGFQTWVDVERLGQPLCGKSRPTHFRGVATVVAQLLSIVQPHRLYLGQKDYQQARIIERLVDDLHLPPEVRLVKTVREADGLAVSTRNQYLSADDRPHAILLITALRAARDALNHGERSVENLRLLLSQGLQSGGRLRIDYAEVLDAYTLEPFSDGTFVTGDRVLLAVAASLGDTRLIDNLVVDV
jgi:pantoate--beta-alanine ligase